MNDWQIIDNNPNSGDGVYSSYANAAFGEVAFAETGDGLGTVWVIIDNNPSSGNNVYSSYASAAFGEVAFSGAGNGLGTVWVEILN